MAPFSLNGEIQQEPPFQALLIDHWLIDVPPPPTVAGSHMSLLRPAPRRDRHSGTRKNGDVSRDFL